MFSPGSEPICGESVQNCACRADRGKSRKLAQGEMGRYREIIAALKLRMTDEKRWHLSTAISKAGDLSVSHADAGRDTVL